MSTSLMAMPSIAPGRDLDAYLNTIGGFPILTAEEEKALAERFYYEEDLDAARELVLCHPFVGEQLLIGKGKSVWLSSQINDYFGQTRGYDGG